MRRSRFSAFLAMLLALALCLGLAACGGNENGDEGGNTPQPPENQGGTTVDASTCAVALSPVTAELRAGESVEICATVSKDFAAVSDLAAAGLRLVWGADDTGDHAGANTDAEISGEGGKVTVTPGSKGKYYIKAQLQDLNGNALKDAFCELTVAEAQEQAPDPVTAGIYVPFVTAHEDFIRGTDVSSLLSVLNSGARFKDWDGKSLGDTVEEQGAGFMRLLKDAGVNWIRLRVWNDPYDKDGHGYGGGNNDLASAVTMGKWATDAGMRVLIDFHYSDFWADPSRQLVPKAWEGMDVDTKAQALGQFTTDSLNTLLDAGVDVGMVQVGNETTNSICGENNWGNMTKLFSAGCDAVHAAGEARSHPILAAIHFESPQNGEFGKLAGHLRDGNVNYDVFATSYYPEWHGTLENLHDQLKLVADNFGVKVMVAETSAAWTDKDGDGVGGGKDPTGYPFTVQGQATEFAAVAQTVRSLDEAGLGLFYWENAWIPVRNIGSLAGAEWEAAYAENQLIWEQYGSGWASSYAGEYDPNAANGQHGGPVMDHKAMFDFDGVPLESLNVFKYMLTGTTGYVNDIVSASVEDFDSYYGEELSLPETATAVYADTTTAQLPIGWDEATVGAVDVNNLGGSYTLTGKISDGQYEATVTCSVRIVKENLIVNGDFEQGDVGYTFSDGWAGKKITNSEVSNAISGVWVMHFWAEKAFEGTATQTVKLEPGTYLFSLSGQGGSMGSGTVSAFVEGAEISQSEPMAFTDWGNIVTASITFTVGSETDITLGVKVDAVDGAWGAFDDWILYKS